MFKRILRTINPVNWVKGGIKRRVIRTAVNYIESWIMRRVRYMPLRDHLSRMALRLEDIIPFVLSSDDRVDSALRDYWQKNKGELLKDQITVIRAIVESEVSDPELSAKLDRFAEDMQSYLKNRG